jgi:ATP-dependent exoDNAse (exonuclease V) beta subunit
VDQAARDRIRTSLHESLLVEASAGTGKTTELVRRIVAVLREGLTTIDSVVAVTFTQKAAGELKLRLRQGLDRARGAEQDARKAAHLEHALAHLEEAAIGTIHAFCAQILRERPVEARIDPDFEELSDPEARRIYARVFRRWLQEKLNQDSPGVRRALARLAVREEREHDTTPMESLENAGWQLIEWRDFPAPWQRPEIQREEVIDTLCDAVRDLAARLKNHKQRLVEPVRDVLPWIEREPRDYDMLEGLLFRLHRVWKRENKHPDPKLFQCLEDFRPVAEADLAAGLRTELWEMVDLYAQAKRRAGKLDFVDLLLLVRNLVRDNEEVRAYLQRRFTHIFVDEFQDTDPLQAEILILLAADDSRETRWLHVTPAPGKLFLVGDPKQSIYKFRRADVQLYQLLRGRLESRGVGVARLSRSFRSVKTIQECVNAAFAPQIKEDAEAAQAGYVPLEEGRPDHPHQPAVIALPAPYPYRKYRIAKISIAACLPGTIVGFIRWLLEESGWKVGDSEAAGGVSAVRSRHIAVLFRRFTSWGADLTRPYVRGLEAAGVPHLLVGSKSFHEREEIDTMRAALTAIEWPEDELAVFATLKGSLFAIPDHLLLGFRHLAGRLNPFGVLTGTLAEKYKPAAEALDLLKNLHLRRNRRPIAETIYLLLEATRAWSGFAFRPAGNQVLANVRRVIDLARQFEIQGGISFRGFVEELTEQAKKAESAEAPVLEEGADGVRLMTVHSAKGLEFPVVILADVTVNLSAENADRHVDGQRGLCAMRLLNCAPLDLVLAGPVESKREHAEGVRVCYVAATRARDLLVVPVVGDREEQGWLAPLNKAVYPPPARRREAAAAPGCPAFGPESVLERPPDLHRESGVRPGLHRPQQGQHHVVWWDPAILPAGEEERFSERQNEILAEDAYALEHSLKQHERWLERRNGLLAAGGVPSLDLITASQAISGPAEWRGEIRLEQTPRSPSRPAGRRFGILLHETMRDVPLDAGRERIAATAALHGRLVAATSEEVDAAARAVELALHHPLLERARRATRLHREYPVTVRVEAGQTLEGIIDLAFEENGRWVIVDFKTDAETETMRERYQAQMAWYAFALERLTGKAMECWLLAV